MSMGKTCRYEQLIVTSHMKILVGTTIPQESISGTTSHMIKLCLNMHRGLYDKPLLLILPSYTKINITHLLPSALLLVLRTQNNTDGNKLVTELYGDGFIANFERYCLP